jgi:succinate dehydrogenase/fumarate reductase flavoprotein subunit
MKNPAWFADLGGELEDYDYKTVDPTISYYIPNKTFPSLEPKDLTLVLRRLKQTANCPQKTGGARVWHLIDAQIRKRGIRVWTNTPVLDLVKDEAGGVIGLHALVRGENVFIRARRGVVLTCGGFEYNEALKWQYLAAKPMGALGSPGNTGDGITMAIGVGAELWHMEAEASTLGFLPSGPEWQAGFALPVRNPGFIYIDKHGERFVNEARLEAHNAGVATAEFNVQTYDFDRIPAYLIMDEENARGKPLGMSIFSYNVVDKGYEWSADNSVEIASGWIKKTDSFAGLADLVGAAQEAIAETLMRYNRNCRSGVDTDFGRPIETLKPLAPPFYVMELRPLLYNTQGGPRRDQHAQVIGINGAPIPRLYAAGEFGSIWGFRYQTSTNFSEAIVYGRIAGANAAAGGVSES